MTHSQSEALAAERANQPIPAGRRFPSTAADAANAAAPSNLGGVVG